MRGSVGSTEVTPETARLALEAFAAKERFRQSGSDQDREAWERARLALADSVREELEAA